MIDNFEIIYCGFVPLLIYVEAETQLFFISIAWIYGAQHWRGCALLYEMIPLIGMHVLKKESHVSMFKFHVTYNAFTCISLCRVTMNGGCVWFAYFDNNYKSPFSSARWATGRACLALLNFFTTNNVCWTQER